MRNDFDLFQPQLQVEEIDEPRLNAQVMASRLASSIERGWFFRRAGHGTVQNIMDAGARGCLVILSGKITGARHRVQKFQKGHIKYCGQTAIDVMESGFATAVKKLGTVGCTVKIMRPGTRLPHEIIIRERAGQAFRQLSRMLLGILKNKVRIIQIAGRRSETVSYTHLTLPTSG